MIQKTLFSFFAESSRLHHDAVTSAAALSDVSAFQQLHHSDVVSLQTRCLMVDHDVSAAPLCLASDGRSCFDVVGSSATLDTATNDGCCIDGESVFPLHQTGDEKHTDVYISLKFPRKKRSHRVFRAKSKMNFGDVHAGCLPISDAVELETMDSNGDGVVFEVIKRKPKSRGEGVKAHMDDCQETRHQEDNSGIQSLGNISNQDNESEGDKSPCENDDVQKISQRKDSKMLRTYTRFSKRKKRNPGENLFAISPRTSADGTLAEPPLPPMMLEAGELEALEKTIYSEAANMKASHEGDSCVQLTRGKSRRVAAPVQVLEAPTTDYEIERADNIQKNIIFLQKLGISSTLASLRRPSSQQPRARSKTKVDNALKIPLRRSNRFNATSEQPKGEGLVLDLPFEAVSEVDYGDSSVWVYTCGYGSNSENEDLSSKYAIEGLQIKGFQSLSKYLYDPNLTRTYTMDVACVGGNHKGLLAAGGHQGRMVIFGTFDDDCESSRFDLEGNAAEEILPLISWKGSKGWISQVKFLTEQPREGSMLLLSSSNDSSLILWDVNKQEQRQLEVSTGIWKGSPKIVMQAEHLHSDGIFGMDATGCHIVTASKDGTIGICRINESNFVKEKIVSGHHSSTIKSVRFRDKHIVADGGADGLICILDLRSPEPCTMCIHNTHASGINVVEWSPCDENILLSASNDPYLLLHDIRNHSEPLHKLVGHMNSQLHRSSRIYRPTFVAGGQAVATPGEGSKQISLYSVSSGKAISRGHIGFDATMVMSSSHDTRCTSRLWIASRKIAEYAPLWQKKEGGIAGSP